MEILDRNYLSTLPIEQLNKKLELEEIFLYDTLLAIDTQNKNQELFKCDYIDPETDKSVIALKHNIENLKHEINLRR